MKAEMQKLEEFQVKEDVPSSSLPPDEAEEALQDAMDLTWVHRWKGSEIRSRLCVRGFNQSINDTDETFASTPVIMVLKLLLVLALAFNWSIQCFDIATAFLHALLDDSDKLWVHPPPEFYPLPGVL